jgi:ribulose 1,5-bisphosphate synthetase/thiazole synthase
MIGGQPPIDEVAADCRSFRRVADILTHCFVVRMNSTFDSDLLIVGGGPAGMQTEVPKV